MATRHEPRPQASQVRQALQVLARHGELIAQAMDGNIEVGLDDGITKAVDALVGINALRPYEEGVYRLNPRLHEFLADHLVSYNANQTLTRLSEPIRRARAQYREMVQLRKDTLDAAFERAQWGFDTTVADISYAIERNQTLLNSMVSTGVDNLEQKLRVNAFYSAEIAESLKDMEKVATMSTDLSERALGDGLPRMRQLLRQRLGSQMLKWRTHLADIQAVISEWLFLVQKVEKRLARLSRAALWLQQNRTRAGVEIELTEDTPLALLRPQAFKLSPQLDVRDSDSLVRDPLSDLVRCLPAAVRRKEPAADPGPQRVISDEAIIIHRPAPVEHQLLRLLQRELDSGAAGTLSLRQWKANHAPDWSASDAGWLFFAASQLRAKRYPLTMALLPDQDPIPVNVRFHDFLVQPRRVARAI
jgi:hypothetical protein